MKLQGIKGATPEKPKKKTETSDGKLILSSLLWAILATGALAIVALMSWRYLSEASQLIGSII